MTSKEPAAAAQTRAILVSVLVVFLACIADPTHGQVDAQIPPSQSVKICHLPVRYISNDRIFARHAMFSTHFLAPHFPQLNVSFDFATLNGGDTIGNVARGMLSSQTQACDAIVGPQWSSVSISVSPLINVPWVSHTATSTALSDKILHPWFSRVIATDDFGGAGMAAAVHAFGWKTASTICVDDSYGQSVLSGFARAFGAADIGGRLELQQCFLADATDAEVEAVVRSIQRGRSRVVAVAAASSRPALSTMVDIVLRLGMEKTHVFVFSESACGSGWSRLADLPGALCVSYTTNGTVTRAYDEAWLAHDPATFFAGLAELGIPELADPYSIGLYSYLIHDAVLLQLATLAAHVDAGGDVKDRKAVLARLREIRVTDHAATGTIDVDASGNRQGAVIVLQNVQPDPASASNFSIKTFASWTAEGGIARNESFGSLYWLAAGFQDPPSLNGAGPDEVFAPSATLLIVMLACILILVMLLLYIYKVGVADSHFLARILASGIGSRFLLMLFDVIDVTLSVVAAVDMLTYEHLSSTFRYAMLCVAMVSILGGLINIGTIALFLRAYLTGDEMTPSALVLWRMRMAKAAIGSLVLNDLPVGVLLFASMVLTPGGAELIVLLAFAVNMIMVGVKVDELTILPVLFQPDAHAVHEAIEAHFGVDEADGVLSDKSELSHSGGEKSTRTPPAAAASHNARSINAADGGQRIILPLRMDTRRSDCRRVLKFIEKRSAPRYILLMDTAKHVVVRMFNEQINEEEFFSVVWRFMGEMYEHARNAELLIEHVRLRRSTIRNPLSPDDEDGEDEAGFFATDDDDDDDGGASEEVRERGGGLGSPVQGDDPDASRRHAHSGSQRSQFQDHESSHSGSRPSTRTGADTASIAGGDSTMMSQRSVRFAGSGSQRTNASGACRQGQRQRPRSASRSHKIGDLSGSALDNDFETSTFLGAKSVRIVNGKAVIDDDAQASPAKAASRTVKASPAGTSIMVGEEAAAAADGGSVCIPMSSALLPRQDGDAASAGGGGGDDRRTGSFNMGGMFVPMNAHFERSGPLPIDSSLSPSANVTGSNSKHGTPSARVTPHTAVAHAAPAASGSSPQHAASSGADDDDDDDDDGGGDLLECAMIKGESRPHFTHSRSCDGLPPLATPPCRTTTGGAGDGLPPNSTTHAFDDDDDDTATKPDAQADIVDEEQPQEAPIALMAQQPEDGPDEDAGGVVYADDDGVCAGADADQDDGHGEPALIVDGALYEGDSDGSYELPDEPELAATAGFGGTAGPLDLDAEL